MDTCHGQKIVNLSMDIEDVFGDKELLDSVFTDILLFLTDNEIPCDLYISGIRFDIMRSNSDLLHLLHSSKFIRCGTHTNTHSFTPISCMKNTEEIRFCEESHFDTASKSFLAGKKSGIGLIEAEFDPDIFRCPGFCWSPDYFEYMKAKNYRYTTIDINYPNPFQFMGLIIMPVIYKPLEVFRSSEELYKQISGFNAVSVYLHPSRLIYDNFWDKKVQRNTYKDITNKVSFIKKIFLYLKANFNMISLSDLGNHCIENNSMTLTIDEVINSIMTKWSWSQLPNHFFSSSQINCIRENHKTLRELKVIHE